MNTLEKHNPLLVLTDLADIDQSSSARFLLALRSAYSLSRPSSNGGQPKRLADYDFAFSILDEDRVLDDSNLYLVPIKNMSSNEEACSEMHKELARSGRERMIARISGVNRLFELYNFNNFFIVSSSPIYLTELSVLKECLSDEDLRPLIGCMSKAGDKNGNR